MNTTAIGWYTGVIVLLVLAFYLFLFYLVGHVARRKGVTVIGLTVLSLFFTPFAGLIVAAIMPADQQVLTKRKLRRGEFKKCPHCAELIRAEATTCRYCGRDIVGSVNTRVEGQRREPTIGANPD